MGFTENLFKAMTIIFDTNHALVKWHCDNCGGTSKTQWSTKDSVIDLRLDFNRHIVQSHERTIHDFIHWREIWPHG